MHTIHWLLLAVAIVGVYWLLLKPWMHDRPELRAFYAYMDQREMTFTQMVRVRFSGLKVTLLARLMWVSGAIIFINDGVLPWLAPFLGVLDPTKLVPPEYSTYVTTAYGILAALVEVARKYSASLPQGVPDATIVEPTADKQEVGALIESAVAESK